MHVSERVAAKAERLSAEGKVRRLPIPVHIVARTGVHSFEVEGDHDTYTVHVWDAAQALGLCSCPAEAPRCSHLIAASAYQQAYTESLGLD